MPDVRRRICKLCHRPDTQVGPISWRGKCERCGRGAMNDNNDAMVARGGPRFDYWRRRMAASVGAVFVDDKQPKA